MMKGDELAAVVEQQAPPRDLQWKRCGWCWLKRLFCLVHVGPTSILVKVAVSGLQPGPSLSHTHRRARGAWPSQAHRVERAVQYLPQFRE